MEAHVTTAMALTSVPVYMDIMDPIVRIWFTGVILHLVKMEDLVGTRAPPSVASVKQAGADCTVMCQVFHVKWLQNKEGWTCHSCAVTLGSVSMLEMFIIATARWATLEVTVRNKWMNAIQILVKMELPVQTFWVDTLASACQALWGPTVQMKSMSASPSHARMGAPVLT